MCSLTNRAEWFHYGQERMLLLEEYSRLTGHCEAVGLDPHFLASEFGNNCKSSNALGNAMCLPCIGTLIFGIALMLPGVMRAINDEE